MHAATRGSSLARTATAAALVLANLTPLRAGEDLALASEIVVTGLEKPVGVVAVPGEPGDRLFILEQDSGQVRIAKQGTLLPEAFLDLSADFTGGGERGLLGMAFHPDYRTNGRFFVYYNDAVGDTRLERYVVDPTDPDRADPASATELLSIPQPFIQHNGGMLLFGPHDGYLYVTVGDGGAGNDPLGNAQDITTFLGSVLRLDVDGAEPYAIPSDNPFVGVPGAAEEIFAFGLRNPWRAGMDPLTGDLYIGDVGQALREEISVLSAGAPFGQNLGWPCAEGLLCNAQGNCPCPDPSFLDPVHEYSHNVGCAVIAGPVYRGSALPELQGAAFFADYCSGDVWTWRLVGGVATEITERTAELVPPGATSLGLVSAFGTDSEGELLIVSHLFGEVYRVTAAPREPDCDEDGVPDAVELSSGEAFDLNGNSIPDACELDLSITDLIPGGVATFQFIGTEPFQPTVFFWSDRGIGITAPCYFGGAVCIDLIDPFVLWLQSANDMGGVFLDAPVPASLAGFNVTLAFQAMALNGNASKVSNPVLKVLGVGG